MNNRKMQIQIKTVLLNLKRLSYNMLYFDSVRNKIATKIWGLLFAKSCKHCDKAKILNFGYKSYVHQAVMKG